MTPGNERRPIQIFRIASLIVPSALAWNAAFAAPHPSALVEAVTLALASLWMLVAAALLLRCVASLGRPKGGPSLLDRLDVLTASGSAMAWLSAAAIAAAVQWGWASLAVIGLLGTVVLHLTVVWTWLRAGDEDPIGCAGVSRSFTPEIALEGAGVVEEVRVSDVRIPIGFRLFASGRIGPRWPMSRYLIEDAESGGELVLESDLGPALRGDHEAEPLELWLQDVFGLCRTPRVRAAAAHLTVLPRPLSVEVVSQLLGAHGRRVEPRPERRSPTEGAYRLREYAPGEDARRIHWVRSLAARALVVRLPDERPPEQPTLDVILDTYLPGVEGLGGTAPAVLMDALVGVWLGVARALAQAGVRVTLVAAVASDASVHPVRCRLSSHTMPEAQRLGAKVGWQAAVSVAPLLGSSSTFIVSCRAQPMAEERDDVRWILVPGWTWTESDDRPPARATGGVGFPLDTAENRWSRRERERLRRLRARRDEEAFARAVSHRAPRHRGTVVARPASGGAVHLEALR